jgi:hypothetical protein
MTSAPRRADGNFCDAICEYQQTYHSIAGEAQASPELCEPFAQRWGVAISRLIGACGRTAPASRGYLTSISSP